jgi:hypothetical protein
MNTRQSGSCAKKAKCKSSLRKNMDNSRPISLPSNGTQFQFITENGQPLHPKSTARFAVRSHARKHAIFQRQRRNNATKGSSNAHRQILQRRPDPALVETLGDGLDELAGSMEFGACGVVPTGLSMPVDARQDAIGHQYSTLSHSVDSDLTNPPTQSTSRQNRHGTAFSKGRELLMGVQDVQEAPLKPYHNYKPQLNYKTRMRLHSAQMLQFGMNLESQRQQQISPQTILGAGRVDPFQSYPIQTEPFMHQLVDYCESLLFINMPFG